MKILKVKHQQQQAILQRQLNVLPAAHACLPLKMYYLFFLCKWNMTSKVQQASVEPEVVMYIKVAHWRSVRLSPQLVIVQDRRPKPPVKSSLRELALSAFSACTAECHNYFYHISGACAALTRGEVSLLLNSFASQSHTHVTKANYLRTHADRFLFWYCKVRPLPCFLSLCHHL